MQTQTSHERDPRLTELLRKVHKLSKEILVNPSSPCMNETHRTAHLSDKQDIEKEGWDSDLESSSAEENSIPTHFTSSPKFLKNITLRDYQIDSLNWLIRLFQSGSGGILADEMGLGKTVQSISILAYIKEYYFKTRSLTPKSKKKKKAFLKKPSERRVRLPNLVIVPLSTISNWDLEFKTFAPSLVVKKFHAFKEERREFIINEMVPSKVWEEAEIAEPAKPSVLDESDEVESLLDESKGTKRSKEEDSEKENSQESSSIEVKQPRGKRRRRKYPLHAEFPFDVLLTTYSVFQKEFKTMKKYRWNYIVLDEAHNVKSSDTQIHNNLARLETKFRLLLTGTPIQNNLKELFTLLQFIQPKLFPSPELCQGWFMPETDSKAPQTDPGNPEERTGGEQGKEASSENETRIKKEDLRLLAELKMIIRPFILRRVKSDVEKSLPNKKETMLFVGLTEVQRRLYVDIVKKDVASLMARNINTKSLNNILVQLRKACSHPYMFPGVEPEPIVNGEHIIEASGKLIVLDKLLEKLIRKEGRKVLIFGQFLGLMDILEDYCILKGYKYFRLDGSTAQADRDIQMLSFNRSHMGKGKSEEAKSISAGLIEKKENKPKKTPGNLELLLNEEGNESGSEGSFSDVNIFLLSTRAGGLGINLQAASAVILYDSDWNPQMDLQAIARSHRIGQTREVDVFRLVSEGTVDQKVVERAAKKLFLDTAVLSKESTSGLSSIKKEKGSSKEEKNAVLRMIRFGAEEIFNMQNSVVDKNESIEAVLQRGASITKAMEEDFKKRFDHSADSFERQAEETGIYTFEGTDYSGKNIKEAKDLTFAIEMNEIERELEVYEKKASILEEKANQKEKAVEKVFKPRPSWAFFNNDRLVKLARLEVERGLTEEENAEKEALRAEGFDWSAKDFRLFISASGKHGRNNIRRIAESMGKEEAEVSRYHSLFWKKARSLPDHASYLSRVEADENKSIKKEFWDELLKEFGEIVLAKGLADIRKGRLGDSEVIGLVRKGVFCRWEEFFAEFKDGTLWANRFWSFMDEKRIKKKVEEIANALEKFLKTKDEYKDRMEKIFKGIKEKIQAKNA